MYAVIIYRLSHIDRLNKIMCFVEMLELWLSFHKLCQRISVTVQRINYMAIVDTCME